MRMRLLNQAHGQKTYVVVFGADDEVVAGLVEFAKQHELSAAHFTAIGAFSAATLAFFDVDRKEYRKVSLTEQVEVLSLVGNIAMSEREPKVHAHAVVAKSDGTAHGGHLFEGHVRPTVEVVVIESPEYLRRTFDEASGLALIDLDAPAH